jgi:hypothetical protein
MYSESYNYPVSVTSETKTFEYTTNVTLDTLENVLSYNVYVNNLFYGTNIITGEGKKLEVNTNDLVRIDITKTDSLLISSVKLIYTLV